MKPLIKSLITSLILFLVATPVVAQESNNKDFLYINVTGTIESANKESIINRINEIRYEACKEGVLDPYTQTPLTLNDYKPVKWSSELEKHAMLRAIEASINWSHERPNGKSTFNNAIANSAKQQGFYHSSECLALNYSLLDSIDVYYSEKTNYLNNPKDGGHYQTLISPENELIGMVAFHDPNIFSAIEFGIIYDRSKQVDDSYINYNSEYTQKIEITKDKVYEMSIDKYEYNINVDEEFKIPMFIKVRKSGKYYPVVTGLDFDYLNNGILYINEHSIVKGLNSGTSSVKITAGNTSTFITINVSDPYQKDLNLQWLNKNGKAYWYEKGIRQGVYGDKKNIIDNIYNEERGREIYDPKSDSWYWLDAVYSGAKAENKEVWIPYMFQDETPGSTLGKWVRYDSEGRMIKGWYQNDKGKYYYDLITGAMFKGNQRIEGKDYYFDEISGVLKG